MKIFAGKKRILKVFECDFKKKKPKIRLSSKNHVSEHFWQHEKAWKMVLHLVAYITFFLE